MSNKQDNQPKPSPNAMHGKPAQPQNPAQAAGQPSAQSLEQVREILFGEQSRDLETRFSGLQNEFQKAIQVMADDARKQREVAQQQMRDELTKLSKQLDTMREQQTQTMQQMKAEVAKSAQQGKEEQTKAMMQMRDDYTKSMQQLKTDTTKSAQTAKDEQAKSMEQMREQASKQSKEMRQSMDQMSESAKKNQDEMRADVTRQLGEVNRKADVVMKQIGQEANQLRNEMVDRSMMSGVLSEMALRFGGPNMSAANGPEDDLGMDELLASRMSNPEAPAAQAQKGAVPPKVAGKNGGSQGKR